VSIQDINKEMLGQYDASQPSLPLNFVFSYLSPKILSFSQTTKPVSEK